MKYIVDVNGERLTVDIDADGVRVDGRPVRAHLADVEGTPIHLVTIASEMHRVASQRGDGRGRYSLWMDGYRYEVEALDERMRAIRDLSAASEASGGPRPLVAPMPGLIVRVTVAPGDRVEGGQGVVVMEAMKMENELRAPGTGALVVKAVHADARAGGREGSSPGRVRSAGVRAPPTPAPSRASRGRAIATGGQEGREHRALDTSARRTVRSVDRL